MPISEKSYKCNFVGSFLSSLQALLGIRASIPERNRVNICGRGCSQNSNIANHQKIHTVEKLYKCNEWAKPFLGVRNVVRILEDADISLIIRKFILRRDLIYVMSVTNLLIASHTTLDTREFIPERTHINVMYVASGW